MKIQIGEAILDKVSQQQLYKNKSIKYLLPCLKEYGKDFNHKLSNVFKVAVGVGDIIKSNRGIKHEKHLFVLVDTTIATSFFISFYSWIKNQSMYEDDYVYGDIQKSIYHMFVLKFPENLSHIFRPFKLGKYSELTSINIQKYFDNHPDIIKIITKDHEYKIKFAKKLNKIYGTTITSEDYNGELDLPPKESLEVFNHHLKQVK